MNRKTTLDIAILISSITGMILSYVYLENFIEKRISLLILGATGILFFVLAVMDSSRSDRIGKHGSGRKEISEILLLSEEGHITAVWDIYGKAAVVFGKDERENQVDVNLKNTDYSGTVDGEHAVMNYSNGSWYIEDLDSENGTRIQKGGEGQKYKVSSREPCQVEKNDIIYLGLAPVKIR
ncbi:MAG: FHA domain-containing protein [Lachnospiraceae bacterium]|nr:FHA domain-containing protein [Lachnospiraceae bacterium]